MPDEMIQLPIENDAMDEIFLNLPPTLGKMDLTHFSSFLSQWDMMTISSSLN